MHVGSMSGKSCLLLAVCALFLQGALQGCSPTTTRTANYNSGTEPHIARAVRFGTIIHVGEATITEERTGRSGDDLMTLAGAAAGGVAGGLAGSTIGAGVGSTLAAAGGVVAGAVVGAEVSSGTTKKIREIDAIELTVELDGGDLVSVVQENDDYYAENDRVRVVFNASGTARVLH